MQPALARTLTHLAENGLRSFYDEALGRGARRLPRGAGQPLRAGDFAAYRAQEVTPLEVTTSQGRLFNMTPPTQGIASLMITGIFDRLGDRGRGFDHIHGLIEAASSRPSSCATPSWATRHDARTRAGLARR
ncbi:MAG: gamma-glutamyltransferase [Paracoccaceae bacterium]